MRDVIATILLLFCSAIFVSCKQPIPEMKSVSPERNYKLALIQMEVEGGKLDENLTRAVGRIRKAALGGARIALLPEVMDLGWTHPSARQFAFEIPEGKTCQALCKAARENSIYVCAGIVEKHGDKLYNAAIIINPSGTVILKHRKINELEIAHDLYATGEGLGVVHTPIGTLGLIFVRMLRRKATHFPIPLRIWAQTSFFHPLPGRCRQILIRLQLPMVTPGGKFISQ